MDMNTVGSVRHTYVKPADSKVGKAAKQAKAAEPQDKVSIGGKIAGGAGKLEKGAAKIVMGTALAAVLAPTKAVIDGLGASAESALEASGMGEIRPNDSLLKHIGQLALGIAPIVGAVGAFAAGAGPIGIMLAGTMLPGALAGTGHAIAGGVLGAGAGLGTALVVGDKAESKVAPKLGKIFGKAAKIATSVAVGLVATPVMAVLGGISAGMGFAKRAIGVKQNPRNEREAVRSLFNEGVVVLGGVSGALGATGGLASVVMGVGSAAGSVATGVKGIGGAIDGFVGGAVQGYDLAGKAVDKLTEKK